MNERESEKIAGMLENRGYVCAELKEGAQIIIVNTCCVRESAENRIFGHLSRLRHTKETQKPDMRCLMVIGWIIPMSKLKTRTVKVTPDII